VGLGRAVAQRRALEDISEEYRSRTMGTLRTAFLSALALELIATISVAVVAVFIGVRLVHGDMALEAGLLALILAPDCYLPLRELGTAHHSSDDGRAALAETTAVLDAPGQRRLAPAPAGSEGPRNIKDVTVRGLTVRHAGRRRAAVGPLSFTAPAGLITALDGPSGAGKSTVLGVLAGTVGATAGTDAAGIEAAGTGVAGTLIGFTPGDVAWVPQHPVMVADTVEEEVLLYLTAGGTGPGDPADARNPAGVVMECLVSAAAAHLAGKHPTELSPGELRRVALARGLARVRSGATVLLLDEPTAHLDRVTADTVQDAIRDLRGRVTVILVAHDRQTRELADHVVPLAAAGQEAQVSGSSDSVTTDSVTTDSVTTDSVTTDSVRTFSAGTAPASTVSRSDVPAVGAGAAAQGLAPKAEATAAEETAPTAGLLGRLLAPVRGTFAGAGAVGTLASVFAVALAGLSGWLILRASEQPPILYLLTAIVGVRFFGIGRAVLRYCERLLLHDAVFASLSLLRGRLWESLSRRALSLRRLLQGGNVLGVVIDDVDTVRDLLPRVVLPPVTALAVAAAAVTTSAWLVPAALPAVLAAASASLVLAPAAALLADCMSARTEQRLRSGVLRRITAALDAKAELQANGAAAPVLDAIRAEDRAATRASQRSAWAEGIGQAITAAACSAAALACAALAAPQVLAGAVAAPSAAVVVLMQLALTEPFAAMTTAVRQYPALRAVLRRIGDSGVLEESLGSRAPELTAREVTAPELTVPELAAPTPRQGGRPGLELAGLSAAWPGGGPVFTDLSAEAEPGRWLAVTGPSGAGKSTLLAVLLGFLPAREGRIGITGRVAWCPQEAHLFDSTIRGNLLLGRPGQTSETRQTSETAHSSDTGRSADADAERDMQQALKAVGLGPLLKRLEQGLDTRIGPGGAFLSGGERQRLAVARTLMTQADVILLDEPTAHLDAESGRALMADLRAGLRSRTVVLVTHNPDDISPDDAVLALRQGREETRSGASMAPSLASG
ncbi:MAG: thiol reductant ABC exporter subunit CydC, partial [Actinomycetota bacterium]|nr:thiol reductant ABC exporter subunit CydC [Actinomycetota bacterium]